TAINKYGLRVYGIEDGFHGLIYRNSHELTTKEVSGILTLGGTILGSSNRDNPLDHEMVVDGKAQRLDASGECIRYIEEMGWDAIFDVGGDGTQHMANAFFQRGIPIIGIPKTIDNDLMATDLTFGFQTAV